MVKAPGPRRAGEARRRAGVERLLGGLRSPQGFPRAVQGNPAELPVRRLSAVLPGLGPVFCAFGRYLSSRRDLLPEPDCQVLAGVPAGIPLLAREEIYALLQQELQQPPEQAYASFDPVPWAATLVDQEHQARLPGGELVRVRLVRPELPAEMAGDLDLLPLLGPAFGPGGEVWIGAAAEDFAATVAAAADLGREAAALELLAQDAAVSGLDLRVPRVVRPLCTSRVLTREVLQGTPLAASVLGPRAGETAIRLCQAWLRQVCFGQVFPVDLADGDVWLLADGRLAWSAGSFATLPAAAKSTLWEYLQAAAAHDPERAALALTREMDGGPTEGVAGLYQRLRQVVPFRDGGWGATDDLAGYLFLHGRCAMEAGFRPRPYLISFYRGLSRLAVLARPLGAGRDPLREGLEGARLAAGLGDMARLLDSEQMKQLMGSYAAALLAMPQRLNELLALAAEGRASIKLEMVEPPAERRRKDSSTAALAALLAMMAVVLLAHHLSSSAGTFGPWIERVAAVLLGGLGAFLFWGLARRS
jgi:predicted unusual protein kinase regulating ubiquinone biosynthesis (AarF/ABC1/UbiB family)